MLLYITVEKFLLLAIYIDREVQRKNLMRSMMGSNPKQEIAGELILFKKCLFNGASGSMKGLRWRVKGYFILGLLKQPFLSRDLTKRKTPQSGNEIEKIPSYTE